MNTPTRAAGSDQTLQTLLEDALDSGVGGILESNDFPALLAHLQRALHRLAAAIIAQAGVPSTKADLDRTAHGLATQIAYDLWNATPIPDKHFHPRKLARPERNTPCPCGSQRKYKQCCGAGDHAGMNLMLPPEEMLARVLEHLPKSRLAEVAALGAPPQHLAFVADHWFHAGRFGDVLSLLGPLFADVSKLDERAEDAFTVLMNCYLELQQDEARQDLVARLKTSPDRQLRSAALQREATLCSDRGDRQGAWRAFNEAQRLTPNDSSLPQLEVLLLLAEGRDADACARVEYWTAKLARDPEQDNRHLIESLHALLANRLDDPLADLPQDYPQRRLLLHIALEGIDPPIWRRVEVENTLTFEALHHVIQCAMGWEDAHLHEFKVGDHRISTSGDHGLPFSDTLPGEHVELGQVIGRRRSFTYIYDFGDAWHHHITIEKRLPSAPLHKPAALLEGGRACPPEDCGGVHGYYRILDAKRTPRRAESREVLEWLGPYRPEVFKLAEHQKQVSSLFKLIR